jgi:hypothetical protein
MKPGIGREKEREEEEREEERPAYRKGRDDYIGKRRITVQAASRI